MPIHGDNNSLSEIMPELSACQMCNVTAPLVKKRAGGISLVARIEGRGLDGEVKECS